MNLPTCSAPRRTVECRQAGSGDATPALTRQGNQMLHPPTTVHRCHEAPLVSRCRMDCASMAGDRSMEASLCLL